MIDAEDMRRNLLIFLLATAVASRTPLTVSPSFVLVEEDWPLERPLPLSICPGNVRILSGDPQKTFSIVKLNETCSGLQLNRELDADKEQADGTRWESFSIVFGGARKSRASLEIQVVDVNDNTPEFINPPTVISVPEDTPEGSAIYKLRTRDPDTGISGMAFYSVDNPTFSVDKRKCNNGECWTTLRVRERLDFEKQRRHEMIITARDGDPAKNNSLETNITVSVHVIDAQDQPPVFITDLSQLFLLEPSAIVGNVVFEIRARDGDQSAEKVNRIRYSLQDNDYLEIDKESGNVKLKKRPEGDLDLRLAVTATEDDEVAMRTEGEIKVKSLTPLIVEKQVKYEPLPSPSPLPSTELCRKDVYFMKINENSHKFEEGEPILFNGDQNVTSIRVSDSDDIFWLRSLTPNSGEIVVNEEKTVDYERFKVFNLTLSSPAGSCKVNIEVVDVNDNAPQFTSDSYLFYVTENNEPMELGEIKATDPDSPKFGPLTYSMISTLNGTFSIANSGKLKVEKSVDREKDPQFALTVRATDGGGLFTDVPVKIVVRDENDNAPKFSQDNFLIDVVEETSSKHKITAVDPDLGENAMLTYTLNEVADNLPIDMNNGILYIGKIDRDSLPSGTILLTVTAEDGGSPSRSTNATITINVEDVNDNRPIFGSSHYSFVVDKNITSGYTVGHVEATDDDATSPNNNVTYVVEDSRFSIDDNGTVSYNSEEPFGRDSWADFKVTAVDLGDPSLNSSSTIAINEHRNGVEGALTTKMNRSESEKREVKWANARMPGYTYSILKASAEGVPDEEVAKWVEIERKTGVIRTLKKIGKESVKEMNLKISMKKNRKEIPVELIIKIVDENDNSPFFKRTLYRANVTEDARIGTVVMTVKAEGTEEDNKVKYSLRVVNGTKDSLTIDDRGVVRTKVELDFEKEKNVSGTVTAVDSFNNNATTQFVLFISDVNDNRPIFKNGSVFTVTASESLPLGASLELPYPLATDADSGRFGMIQYSIIGGENFFTINEKSSIVSLKKELDYEKQRTHSLTVRAVDNQGKIGHHEVFASITVLVEDANDNSPIIHNLDLSHLSITEDAKEGDVVAVISVTDLDGGGSQAISLSSNHSLFRVDESARLVVASSLNGYAGERICGVLTAIDSGKPPRNSSVPFCVGVQGTASANNPLIVYPKPNSIHYFDENEHFDELIRVKVMKTEKPQEITFKLDQGFKKDWEQFKIDNNGSLTALAPFDFEKKPLHEIRITACNVARNCTFVNLFISINDKNDNCPVFTEKEVKMSIMENERSPIPRRVGVVPSAVDDDFHPDNKRICYSVDSPLFFFHNISEPVLFTNRSFDREQHREYLITISAFDCSHSCVDPSRPVNATIKGLITIEDLNDNFPNFNERIYYATVIQGQNGPGSHIATITATDLDDEKNGLRYSIKGVVRSEKQTFGVTESPISVDAQTGEVSAVDLLREPSYQFTLSVLDGAGHEDTASVVISVVTYDQQTELLFDAPYEYVIRNEKNIVRLLSSATSLTAVIDRCRQNSNFTVVLAHFLDESGKFVDVDQAINVLIGSASSARTELRNAYGLREATPQSSPRPKTLEAIAVGGGCALVVLVMLLILIWCRQRNDYSRKLKAISVQAKHLGSQQGSQTLQKKMNSGAMYWTDGTGTIPHPNRQSMGPPPGPLMGTVGHNGLIRAPPAPPPLQSTEL